MIFLSLFLPCFNFDTMYILSRRVHGDENTLEDGSCVLIRFRGLGVIKVDHHHPLHPTTCSARPPSFERVFNLYLNVAFVSLLRSTRLTMLKI